MVKMKINQKILERVYKKWRKESTIAHNLIKNKYDDDTIQFNFHSNVGIYISNYLKRLEN